MNRSTSLKINEPYMIFGGQPARHLVDSTTINLDLRGIDTNNLKIVRPVYSEKLESPQYLPTASQVLNTLTQETLFEIDKKWIRKDFNAEYNKEQRDWYFTMFSKEQTEKFKEMYYAYMNRKEINNIIDYPFDKQISTIGRIDKNWRTSDNKVIESKCPPQQGVKIELANLEIEASSYKDIKKDLDKFVEKSDIKKLHSQMNYSNIVLEVMTKQLERIENLNQVENASSSTYTKGKPPIKLIYKLINTKIRKIRDRTFANTIEINKLKAYPKLRNYYPRPSLADVQYEERGDLVQNSFSGNKISEWNLDGMSEQVILNLTCQMTMTTTAHKTKENERLIILNCVKNETNQEDFVSTLIYTIIHNFIRDPNVFKNKAANQLTNLYFPIMSDYRWYRDTFLSKVTLREDGFANFWKEKFIARLPKLFSEKVRMNLERHYSQPIVYESLTYGQLHNIITEIDIQVCTDFKLQNKIRKENASSKKELGTFCHQYDVEPMRSPSTRHKKKQKQERSYNRSYKQYKKSTYKSKRINNKNQNPIAENKQRFNKNTKYKSIKREVKCWKCGKIGHYANKCRLEDETLKKNLLNILINSDKEETSSEELEESEDNLELEQIETLSTSLSSSKEEDGYCLEVGICNCNDCRTISTLTKDQTFVLINIIDKLEETSLKDEFIRQLNDLIIKDEKSRKEISNKSMKEIMNRFKPTNQEVTDAGIRGKRIVKKQKGKENVIYEEIETDEEDKEDPYTNILNIITTYKWHTEITLVIKEEIFKITTLIDSRTDVNCIQEGLIPIQYYEKTLEGVTITAKGLITKALNKEFFFEFIKPLRTRELNILKKSLIRNKRSVKI
ncbi:hypothetical protein CR513_30296, partial [Mucuna pruriens]